MDAAAKRQYQLEKTVIALVIMDAWIAHFPRVYPDGDVGPDPPALADVAAIAILEWLTEIPGRDRATVWWHSKRGGNGADEGKGHDE